jgi:hypothetical protein
MTRRTSDETGADLSGLSHVALALLGSLEAPSRPMLPSCSRQSRTSPSGGATRHPCTAAARDGFSRLRSGRE